jgi:hypothetical protein
MRFDAVSSPLSDSENRRSLSYSYRKLFQKYPPFFYFETDNSQRLKVKQTLFYHGLITIKGTIKVCNKSDIYLHHIYNYDRNNMVDN